MGCEVSNFPSITPRIFAEMKEMTLFSLNRTYKVHRIHIDRGTVLRHDSVTVERTEND